MMWTTVLLQAALWIWFPGCTVTYRPGKYTLVEGTDIKGAEFVTLCTYSLGLILFHTIRPAGERVLLSMLVL